MSDDESSACQVILCMASGATGSMPSECKSAMRKFFAIWDIKPHKLLTKRLNFLKLCSTGNDPQLDNYRNNLTNITSPNECTAQFLNKKIDYKQKHRYVRTTATIPNGCRLLAKNQYTPIKLPKYICNSKFYRQIDFNRGYEIEEVTKEIYETLGYNQRESKEMSYSCHHDNDICYKTIYYQKLPIKKLCWIK